VVGLEDHETEDEVTTDPKELYKRFEGFMNKGPGDGSMM
jgi:hypothetical protein|tara:strand:+ start:919 stop:1035 length:117 start_codon:yes stop_codon:yes gene_type:complete